MNLRSNLTNTRLAIRSAIHSLRLPEISSEWLILLASLAFASVYNSRFWLAALKDTTWADGSTWLFAGALFALVTAIHAVLFSLIITRHSAKPLLAVLFVVTALAMYYMDRYSVYFDTTMIRNIINTDVKEVSELLSLDLAAFVLLYGGLPAFLLVFIRTRSRPWRKAALTRIGFIVAGLIVAAGSVALVFQDFSALMRNHKEVRYLITPANFLVSLTRVMAADTKTAQGKKIPIATDARLGDVWEDRTKPTLLVIVVGETARASNWGLNGYARQTTPRLAQLDVVNFPQMTSCGTNTEVSLPCMFSPFGRRNYDETGIRQHESLLHVLAKTGFHINWRDNQSGCKGVCEGLEQQRIDGKANSALCDGERCVDEVLLDNFDAEIKHAAGNLVIVLHQLGNHGPAYYRRYPPAFRKFMPTCDTAELGKCTRDQIVNSYDNALLYTDYVLSRTVEKLQQQTSHNAALIYVSDHGESLGENGIYLHGLPNAIAPKEQTRVPMVMWMSNGFASSHWIDVDCFKRKATQPLNHDYLFHSVLGMMGIRTQLYDKSYDITESCRL